MEANRAAENLQTIRTLMERSALYRRALAPIMIWCGVVGIVGGGTGWCLRIDSVLGFVLFWAGVAAIASIGSFILARRQALKDSEPFWSPPTKRVVQAMFPPFFIGAVIGGIATVLSNSFDSRGVLTIIWCWAFGCGIHSAGFFMPRGIKLFGWLFILTGCLMIPCPFIMGFRDVLGLGFSHLFMAAIFGGLHLAYGIYLYLTESRKTVA